MALITNYATLVAAVADTLNRDDLTAFVPNFVQNCESTIYKSLRIRAMETALSVTIASGVAALPTDYVELKYAYVDGSPVTPLKRVAPDQIYQLFPTRSGGNKPKYISVESTNFIFGAYPSNLTVKGIYYRRLSSLVTTNTNWFITDAPDLLLYGSLLESAPFLNGDERTVVWQAFYKRAFDSVSNEETRQKSSGGGLQTRVM